MKLNTDETIIESIEKFVRPMMVDNDPSHDWNHVKQVHDLAVKIREMEKKGDLFIIRAASLFHDVADYKYSKDEKASGKIASVFLKENGVNDQVVEKIVDIIDHMGFKEELSGKKRVLSTEGQIVQDADRLMAMGAIGIARCFAFSGQKKNPFHIPELLPQISGLDKDQYIDPNRKHTSINHFKEKLFKLFDLLNTESAKLIGKSRHDFMRDFVTQFEQEWSGISISKVESTDTKEIDDNVQLIKYDSHQYVNDISHISIYTDGSCSGNPGPGGWASTISLETTNGDTLKMECKGGKPMTTSNEMEMTAMMETFNRLNWITSNDEEHQIPIKIHTDSKYVFNGLTIWSQNWIHNGWKTSNGKPPKNSALWKMILHLWENRDKNSIWFNQNVELVWVKGHDGNEGNELADKLARQETEKMKSPDVKKQKIDNK